MLYKWFVNVEMHARFRFLFKTVLYQMKSIIMLNSHWCSCSNGTATGADVQYHGSSCLCSWDFSSLWHIYLNVVVQIQRTGLSTLNLGNPTLYTELSDNIVTGSWDLLTMTLCMQKRLNQSIKKETNLLKKMIIYIKLHTNTKFH